MDTSKLVNGAIVRMTGRVIEMPKNGENRYKVMLYGQTKSHLYTPMDFSEMNAAELICVPEPKYTKAQIEAIERVIPRFVTVNNATGAMMQLHIAKELYKFLDANTSS